LAETACIVVLNDKGKDEKTIPFHFNPSDFTVDYTPKYGEPKGLLTGQGHSEFINEGSATLSLKMTLNGYPLSSDNEKEAKDISGDVKNLRALVNIKPDRHKPPSCKFVWGKTIFCGDITNMNVSFTMFTSEGMPVRATVSLTFNEKKDDKVPLESPDRTKRRVVTQDMPLYMVAYEAYDDCGQWRHIAEANGIKNPRRVEPGTVLKVPKLEA
jgi:hypothetical protein